MNSMMGSRGASPTTAGGLNNSTGFYQEKIPKGYSAGKIQQFSPEQIQLFKQLFGHLGPESYLSKLAGGDQSFFDEMEAPAFRQFNEQLGNIGSRFSGMGMGARKSSGFQNYTNQAASSFAQDLASQRQALQRQAIMDLMGLSESLLQQRPFERTLTEKPKPFWQTAGASLAGGLGQGLGSFLTGGF